MNRRKFLSVSTLVTLGSVLSTNLIASAFENIDGYSLIDIRDPELHSRHGMFSLEAGQKGNGEFFVQRDVFTKNGLETPSGKRISSIFLSYQGRNIYEILDSRRPRHIGTPLTFFLLSSRKSHSFVIKKASMIFSEFSEVELSGVSIRKNQGLLCSEGSSITARSHKEQFLMVYEM